MIADTLADSQESLAETTNFVLGLQHDALAFCDLEGVETDQHYRVWRRVLLRRGTRV